jgi:hypothetical protein
MIHSSRWSSNFMMNPEKTPDSAGVLWENKC